MRIGGVPYTRRAWHTRLVGSERRIVKQVLVEIICLAPEDWGLCHVCQTMMTQAGMETQQVSSGLEDLPPEWKQELDAISDWIFNTTKRYGRGVLFRIYDPRSLPGLLWSLHYGVHSYPAFVIAGRHRVLGLDVERLNAALMDCGLLAMDAGGQA